MHRASLAMVSTSGPGRYVAGGGSVDCGDGARGERTAGGAVRGAHRSRAVGVMSESDSWSTPSSVLPVRKLQESPSIRTAARVEGPGAGIGGLAHFPAPLRVSTDAH